MHYNFVVDDIYFFMKDFNPVHIREWWAGPLFDRACPWEWFQPPRIEHEKNIFRKNILFETHSRCHGHR